MNIVPGSISQRPLRASLLIFGTWVLLAGAGLLVWGHYRTLDTIAGQLDRAQPWLTCWRITVYGVVIGGWPRWVGWLAWRRRWTEDYRAQILSARWRLAGWFMVLELLIAQNLLGRFLEALAG